MTLPAVARWAVGLLAAVAVPGVACFGYYSLEDLGESARRFSTLIILAYPLALIGLLALVASAVAHPRSPRRLWASALCFVLPTLLLLVLRQ